MFPVRRTPLKISNDILGDSNGFAHHCIQKLIKPWYGGGGWTDSPAIDVATATAALHRCHRFCCPAAAAAAAAEVGREIDLSHLDDLLTSDISNRSIYFANIFRLSVAVVLLLFLIKA